MYSKIGMGSLRNGSLQNLLESIYGDFASSGFPDSSFSGSFSSPRFRTLKLGRTMDGSGWVPGAAMDGRGTRADHRQLSAAAQNSAAGAGRAAGRGRGRDQGSLLVLLA